MHPNPIFRVGDRARLERFITDVGFGKVFASTPDGPRVAHTPMVSEGGDKLRFHLARGNSLSRHLVGQRALALIDGPHGYVSPRWYEVRDTVPTWDYVALELEGSVRPLLDEELEELLHALIRREETRLGPDAWTAEETSPAMWNGLFKAIAGFELEIEQWRPTWKLSQKKSQDERETIAAAHRNNGNSLLADAMTDKPQ